MTRCRVAETNSGITGEMDTKMYDVMMRRLRDRGWIETDMILKQGITSGLALEIGPGPGYMGLEWLKKTQDTRLNCLEISADMIALARKNAAEYGLSERVEYLEGNAQQIPFDDRQFDAVFTSGSLHEWEHPELIFNEIDRVLKPGGKYVISDMRRDITAPVKWFLYLFVKSKEMKSGLVTSINAAYILPEIRIMLQRTKLNGWEISKDFMGILISGQKTINN